MAMFRVYGTIWNLNGPHLAILRHTKRAAELLVNLWKCTSHFGTIVPSDGMKTKLES